MPGIKGKGKNLFKYFGDTGAQRMGDYAYGKLTGPRGLKANALAGRLGGARKGKLASNVQIGRGYRRAAYGVGGMGAYGVMGRRRRGGRYASGGNLYTPSPYGSSGGMGGFY